MWTEGEESRVGFDPSALSLEPWGSFHFDSDTILIISTAERRRRYSSRATATAFVGVPSPRKNDGSVVFPSTCSSNNSNQTSKKHLKMRNLLPSSQLLL